MKAEAIKCVAEDKGMVNFSEVERPDAKMIASAKKLAALCVPDGERKIPEQVIETRLTPCLIRMEK
ncbi:MAG TPA: hypothetical protein VGT24_04345 [Candidatus Acidoferrales bacterium]|nr:hypothetical protein [Candidatus Acidoferrales bacterium]